MSSLKDAMEPEMKRSKKEQNESDLDGNEDRLSDLPDCILLHIMSFMTCKDAVRTGVLSRRWEHLWKRVPTLVFNSLEFYPLKNFNKSINKILSLRDDSVALHTLDFVRRPKVELYIFRKVISYAVSHNVRRLTIDTSVDVIKLQEGIFSSIFSCQTLTFLNLSISHIKFGTGWNLVFPNSLNLPVLTSLHLKNVAFTANANDSDQAEPFSTLNKLNNLVIDDWFTLVNAQTLCIRNTTLSSLTTNFQGRDTTHFVQARPTPYKIVLSTPNLRSFAFEGVPCHGLSSSSFSSLEQVYIDADTFIGCSKPPFILLNWLKELTNVQSLTVTVNTLQVLFFIPDLMKMKLPSLGNLKLLKVKMLELSCGVIDSLGPFKSMRAKLKRMCSPTIPNGALDFLLQNSRSSKVVIIQG